MSTKCTIACGDNFHLSRELCDDDHIYLRLETTHFEAGCDRVLIPIPIHVWETIRHLGAAELDLVDLSDEELLTRVHKEVGERIAEYEKVSRERPDHAPLFAIVGSLVYGAADEPPEDQIRHGMEYFKRQRTRQQELRARIASLRCAVRERSN
jgi:hypothetical protein